MKNIAYAGVADRAARHRYADRRRAAEEKFAARRRLRDIEPQGAAARATSTRREHFECPLPFHLEKMDANGDKILIDGNTATALGCIYAGATVAAWYPITPATSVMDAFKEFCEQYRHDPDTGENNYVSCRPKMSWRPSAW